MGILLFLKNCDRIAVIKMMLNVISNVEQTGMSVDDERTDILNLSDFAQYHFVSDRIVIECLMIIDIK